MRPRRSPRRTQPNQPPANPARFNPQDNELFESKGLKQFGIDILARRRDRKWVAVSCKRYQRMPPAKLKAWCKDFLDHWADKWSGYPIAEFILAVTVRPQSELQRKEITRQQEQFAELGIAFGIWHTTELDRLLRDHPRLVRRHFSQHWAEFHCNVAEVPATGQLADVQLLSFDRNVSDDVRRLVEARDQEHTRDLTDLLERLGRPVEYGRLEEKDKQTYRRVAVSEALERNGHRGATSAMSRFPGPVGDDLMALVALDQGGPEAALAVLDASDEIHAGIRAQVLLMEGDSAGALCALGEPTDPMDIGVMAKAQAAQGRAEEALDAMRIAEANSDSAAVARLGLAVRFACATAPSIGTCVNSSWPEPVPFELLRRDEFALSLVREGAEIALVRSRTPGIGPAERQTWLTWRVAFLCCEASSRPAAATLVRECIDRGEVSAGMVLWALWCDLDIDRRRAVVEMERSVRLNSAEPADLFALLYLLEADGAIDRARQEMRVAGPRFARFHGFAETRDRWTLRLDGDRGADTFADALDRAVREDRWQELMDAVAETGQGPGESGRRLVVAARTLARFGRLDDLASLAERLVAEIGTADAIELAARGLARRGEWNRVDELLSNTDAFPGRRLPHGAAALLAEARAKVGNLSGSLAIRRELAGTPVDPQGLMLARSLLAAGDLGGAASMASAFDVATMEPGDVATAIAIARIVNPSRARSLTESALALTSIPDELLPHLLEHGYALGLDERVSPLLAEAIASSRVPGRVLSREELVEHMVASRRAADNLNDIHRKGEMPMQLFAPGVNLDAAELVLGGRHVSADPVLLAQNGHRRAGGGEPLPGEPEDPARPGRLALDLPALLLARRFGFLTELSRAFGALCIPPGLMFALVEAISRAAPQQASVAEAQARVGDALRRGAITVADGPADIRVGDPADGADVAVEEFVSRLSTDDPVEARTVAIGRVHLRQLASNDLWEEALHRYEVTTTKRDRDGVLAELRAAELDAARRETLSRLVEELSEGLNQGRFEIMAEVRDPHAGVGSPGTADEAVLSALFQSRFPTGCALFSGDRCLNAFVSLNETPVVGVSKVLEWMVELAAIPNARRHRVVSEMRTGNVHFLPLEAEEVMRSLLRAPVAEESLVETEELRSMRRHAAVEALLHPAWHLDATSGLDGQAVEFALVHNNLKTVGECLREIWRRDDPVNVLVARSDWVIDSLVTERLERIPLGGTDADREFWAAMIVGRLYALVFEAGLGDLDRAARLAEWVGSRMVGPRMLASSEYLRRVSGVLAPLVEIMLSGRSFPSSAPSAILDAFRARVWQVMELLPNRLGDALIERVAPEHPVRREEHVIVGDCLILPADFDAAVRTAAIEGASDLRLRNPDGAASGILGRRDARRGVFEVVLDTNRFVMNDLRLELISRSALDAAPMERRTGHGARETAWIDEAWSRGCSRLVDADALIDGAYTLRLSLADRALEGGPTPARTFYPPDPAVLDRHLDVATDDRGTTAEWFQSQTTAAIADMSSGSAERLERLFHLPIDPGPALYGALATMDAGMRAATFEPLDAVHGSVIARTHLRRCGMDSVDGEGRIALPSIVECASLAALFHWTWRITERMAAWRAIEKSWRLLYCWYHASQLMALFDRAGVSPHQIPQTVDDWDRGGTEPALLPVHDARREIAGPEVDAKTVYLALHLHACPDGPDAGQVDEVKRAVLNSVGENAYPDSSIVEAATMPDAFGSLFSTVRATPPEWLGEVSFWLVPSEVEALLVTDPPWHEDAPVNARIWVAFLHWRRRFLPPAEAAALVSAWKRIDVRRQAEANREWLTAVTMLCALRHDLEVDDQQWLAGLLNELSEIEHAGPAADQCLEGALRFLVQPPGPHRVSDMANDVRRLDRCLLSRASETRPILTRLARELGPVDSGQLWQFITSLRAA